MPDYTAISGDGSGKVLASGTLYTIATALAKDPNATAGRSDGRALADDERQALNFVFQAIGSSRREPTRQNASRSKARELGPIPVEDIE